ncbi:MAG: NAD-dependent epimerase/dehydratase family protein [Burkholderiales bacterium]|jgi:UDP-glucuronate 4-epimerase|nr:NAD-dependent epimerase/dehydratase family protein [Burkholderiales bacterium]
MSAVLVTGAAGFIGMHVCERLLAAGRVVVGLDNFDPYYDVALKRARWARLVAHAGFVGVEGDICDAALLARLFAAHRFDRVVHLAAQAGVRWSIDHPHDYVQANLSGFVHVLEACRHHGRPHLVFASTSSVYGLNATLPYAETHGADHPVSLYAATKKANEAIAHSYAHLYALPVTGLRFFTVYGPWGRPDMSPMLFASAILDGRPIDLFNEGRMRRDFTYVDDIAEGVVRVADHVPAGDPAFDGRVPDPSGSRAPYRIFNIGNAQAVELGTFVATLERLLGRTADKRLRPMQPGDVLETAADTRALEAAVGFAPRTSLDTGLARFVDWYRGWHARPRA